MSFFEKGVQKKCWEMIFWTEKKRKKNKIILEIRMSNDNKNVRRVDMGEREKERKEIACKKDSKESVRVRRLKEGGNKVRRGKEGKHVFGESGFVKSEKKEMSQKRLK